MVYNNILEAIGNTPMIRLNRMPEEGSAEVLVKMEALNVGGSIKTRTALNMIEQAEKDGLIGKETIIVELYVPATSSTFDFRLPSTEAPKFCQLKQQTFCKFFRFG